MKSLASRNAKMISGSRIARLLLAAAASSALLVVGCSDDSGGAQGWQSRTPSNKGSGAKGTGPTEESPEEGTTNGADPQVPGNVNSKPGDPARPGDPLTTPGKTGTFDVNVGTPTLTGDLLDEKTTVINVAPTDGFTGAVTLALEGAGPEIVAVFDGGAATTQVNVSGASASANLKIKSSKSGASTFKVVATAGEKKISKDVTFTASKTLTINIPADAQMNKGTAGNPRTDAFGPSAGIVVTSGAGLTLNIKNLDATGHIIHGGGNGGFNHGNTNAPIQQGDSDNPRTLSTGTFNFYLHDQGQVTTGKLIVK